MPSASFNKEKSITREPQVIIDTAQLDLSSKCSTDTLSLQSFKNWQKKGRTRLGCLKNDRLELSMTRKFSTKSSSMLNQPEIAKEKVSGTACSKIFKDDPNCILELPGLEETCRKEKKDLDRTKEMSGIESSRAEKNSIKLQPKSTEEEQNTTEGSNSKAFLSFESNWDRIDLVLQRKMTKNELVDFSDVKDQFNSLEKEIAKMEYINK